MSKDDYDSALEYGLKSSYSSQFVLPLVTSLFWLVENEESALSYYQRIKKDIPNYSTEELDRFLGVFHYAPESRKRILEAFIEVETAAKASE